MSSPAQPSGDDYGRVDYGRLIDWNARLERETPFLERILARAPEPSIVDLGCGPGAHARFCASRGARAFGIDRSTAQIERAGAFAGEFGALGPTFAVGEIGELPRLTDARFGAAICLGNVVPYLDDAVLADALAAVHEALVPGGVLVAQLLNYPGMLARNLRHLPLCFRPHPEQRGERIWLRTLTRQDERFVWFHSTTLHLCAGDDPATRVESVTEARVRAWSWDELARALIAAGFVDVTVSGDIQGAPFDAKQSHDIVFQAARAP